MSRHVQEQQQLSGRSNLWLAVDESLQVLLQQLPALIDEGLGEVAGKTLWGEELPAQTTPLHQLHIWGGHVMHYSNSCAISTMPSRHAASTQCHNGHTFLWRAWNSEYLRNRNQWSCSVSTSTLYTCTHTHGITSHGRGSSTPISHYCYTLNTDDVAEL